MKKNHIYAFITILLLLIIFLNNMTIYAELYDVNLFETNLDYIPSNVVDMSKKNLTKSNSIDIFINEDGTLTVSVQPSNEEDNYIYIQEYDKGQNCINTMKIKKVFPYFGSLVKDNNGNYYALLSKDKKKSMNNSEKDMVLVKYNSHGVKTDEIYFNETLDNPWNIKKSLFNGSKMKIDKDKLYIYYGRSMLRGKNDVDDQSFIAIFDLNTFTNITNSNINNIYSKKRDLIPCEDGFITVDLDKTFKLSKFTNENFNSKDLLNAGKFSEIGGIEKTTNGYIVAGINEKIENSGLYNIFIQNVNDDLSIKKGPIYITDYSNKYTDIVSNLKMVQTGYNKYILLWEMKDKAENYKGTYMAIVDEEGIIIENVRFIGNYRLNINDDVSYSSKNNKIYWAINSESKIVINEFDSGSAMEKAHSISLNVDAVFLKLDETFGLNAIVNPENAIDKSITWKSDNEEIATVDKDGIVTASKSGKVDVIAVSTADENITAKCTINIENDDDDNSTSNDTDDTEKEQEYNDKTSEDNNTTYITENSTINKNDTGILINDTKDNNTGILITNNTTNTTLKNNTGKKANTAKQKNNNSAVNQDQSFERRVIDLCNKERAQNGLSPLAEDSQLMSIAKLKSQDMASSNYFDHTSPRYGSAFNMMDAYGVRYSNAGENIAMGQQTPEDVVESWMNSSGHRANILSKDYTNIGVGVAKNQKGELIWTEEFTRP